MYTFIILIHVTYISYKIFNFIKKNDFNNYFYLNNYKNNKKDWINYKNDINTIFKYNNNYTIRNYIDFDRKKIIIETINKNNLNKIFEKEIKNIFSYNTLYDFYTEKKFNENDINNKEIIDNLLKYSDFLNKFRKNINIFSKLIIKQNFNKNYINSELLINYIEIDLILDSENFDIYDCINCINKIKKKYNLNIDYKLILSIINAESNFNPYAISKSKAIGLMQIIQNKSGIDVFKKLKKKNFPNLKYLFDYNKNIKIGLIYIDILQKKYLSNILDPASLRYLTIASYNGGINNVLKIFSNSYEESIKIINSIEPENIYKSIIIHHPSIEIKKYLKRVNNFYINYELKKII